MTAGAAWAGLAQAGAARPRKVLYLSGTRADFGLMRSTLQALHTDPRFDLAVVVTGTHLSADHGHTVDDVRAAGLPLLAQIPVDVRTQTARSMSQAVAQCLQEMGALLEQQRPDILLLLGDRGEMLAGALAALHQGVVTVHIHGGERSGTVDEPVRHAISKLSSYHLVATEESKDRLLRMGEAAERIYVVGAPGLDGLLALAAGERSDALQALGMPLDSEFVLAVFHPVVQQSDLAYSQARALIEALTQQPRPVLWLLPNADAGAQAVLRALGATPLPTNWRCVAHLDRALFAKAMRHAAVMIGNSSAGIIEAASFGTPVINMGERQRLRQRNINTVDALPQAHSLSACLQRVLAAPRFACDNCYGDGQSGPRIVQLLSQLPLGHEVLEKTNAY